MKNKTASIALGLALIALAAVFLRPTSEAASKQETTFERVMRTHTIRCGYAIWNPVLSKDPQTGQLSGITYDLMEAIGKKLNLQIEWAEETAWGTVVEGLTTHRYDMICNGIGIVGSRARVISFTQPIFYIPQYIVVRADEMRLQHNGDLNSEAYKFVVLDGTGFSMAGPKLFSKAQFHSLPQSSDWSMIFEDVVTGKADATAVAKSDFDTFEKNNPQKVKILNKDEPLQIWPHALGLPQNDMAMKIMVDAAIDEIKADDSLGKIMRAHSNSPDEFLLPAKPYEAK